MNADQIREAYIEFFKSKGHQAVVSDSLVPKSDPSLLFTGAGMNQFKEQFLGKNVTYKRAVSCQKCLRTGDLENVGRTSGHHTFFEMLGNFSFGDYFKKEAIVWAWEFMTEVLKIDAGKLWVSVYRNDEEAYEVWRDEVKISESRIVRLGAKDNFWPSDAPSLGPNGPCGPCSEIFYDWAESAGCGKPSCSPACDCGRFVEVWNLVFTQFDRQPDGSLAKLANKNIDTGMGLERITAVMESVRTNYRTSSFTPIIEALREGLARAHKKVPAWDRYASEQSAIADHLRAVVFSIADGAMPSNEGRGYVIRKLIRRSILHSWGVFGDARPFLFRLVPVVADVMVKRYPDIKIARESISSVIEHEEENFISIMENQGPNVLASFDKLKEMSAEGEDISRGIAEKAFSFYDTYGIPYDLLEEFAEKKGLKIDRDAFEALMEEQRDRSRQSTKIKDAIFSETFETAVKSLGIKTEFVGYQGLSSRANVAALFIENERVDSATEGKRVQVILDRTPFYGESGGQSGDEGVLSGSGVEVAIHDVKTIGNSTLHIGTVRRGTITVGDTVESRVDEAFRKAVMRNHTATHLLQSALRSVLGEHVRQAGSAADNKRLRFDFTHGKKLNPQEVDKVEDRVNGAIKNAGAVNIAMMGLEEAKGFGALALFGEKYDSTVRVVTVGDSKELCGGTHVENVQDIGFFKLTGESSVASGVRRIEALTHDQAREAVCAKRRELIERLESCVRELPAASKDDIDRVEGFRCIIETIGGPRTIADVTLDSYPAWRDKGLADLMKGCTDAEEFTKKVSKKKKKDEAKNVLAGFDVDRLIRDSAVVSGSKIVTQLFENADMKLLRGCSDILRTKLESGAFLLGSSKDGNVFLVCSVTKDLIKRGLHAGNIIREVAKIVNGSGGGRPDFAQAGGKDASKLDAALVKGREMINEELL
ncbi:MAG: alanine--tRNA ligase [Candidatus Omnitrophota bacterium]